ncbi:MAG: leucine-rich repeat protein [Bacteroidaceae bacterium]|nr:leucine-rich repeat protein [Bacteroidaceae bacterium]
MKLSSLFTLCLCLLCALRAHSQSYDFVANGIYYNILDESQQTLAVTHGDKTYTGNISIPATLTHDGTTYNVTAVADWAFHASPQLTAVTLPPGLTTIGNYAFADCTRLTTLQLPATLTTIGGGAFSGTAWLQNQGYGPVYAGSVLYTYKGSAPVGISLTLQSGTKGIATAALSRQSGITTLNIPTSLQSLGEESLLGCAGLQTLILPRGITQLPAMSLYNCQELQTLILPETLSRISDYALSHCTQLQEIVILRSIPPTITATAFDEDTRKTAVLHIPMGSLNRYRTHPYWATFSHIVEIGGTIDDFYDRLKRGDMDEDGTITVNDITELIRFYLDEAKRMLK